MKALAITAAVITAWVGISLAVGLAIWLTALVGYLGFFFVHEAAESRLARR